MENPCLTFVTPTLLAGDRSLADVVAHEIAHSWTGNLVTNATWEHFWLNEGWTIWVERTVMARVRGDPRMYDLRAKLGWKHLEDDVDVFSKQGKPQLTALVPPLDDQTDPDDAFSSVPYEKGSSLLRSLEQIVGVKRFARFARRYVDHFADRVVTSAAFKSFVIDSFAAEQLDTPTRAKLDAFPWDAWYHKAGMPPSTPVFDDALARAAIECADAWLAAAPVTATGGEPLPGVNGAKFAEWHTMMKSIFLERLQSDRSARRAARRRDAARACARILARRGAQLRGALPMADSTAQGGRRRRAARGRHVRHRAGQNEICASALPRDGRVAHRGRRRKGARNLDVPGACRWVPPDRAQDDCVRPRPR